MYTEQTAYEAIREYFTRPGAELARTYNIVGTVERCDYRSENGAKCAIGCLIPDTIYEDAIEGKSGGEALSMLRKAHETAFVETFGNPDSSEYTELVQFLEEAQMRHDDDRTRDVAEFVQELDMIAAMYDLEVVS